MKTTLILSSFIFSIALCIQASSENLNPQPFIIPEVRIPAPPAKNYEPKVLKDENSGIIYYLESDRRHISAISPKGEILWTRNPFVDAKLGNYRMNHPVIVFFDFPKKEWWKIHEYNGKKEDFISINFDSSQFGAIRKSDGKFISFGQD